jgi:SAM-dependent methyltransferase
MIHSWKILNIAKGVLTAVPVISRWRARRRATGGTDSPRYCYSVWLRHLLLLDKYGFSIKGAHVGELGPGDSIGIGLAALISGAARYVGLDIVPFSGRADLEGIFEELVQMYSDREPIPDHNEFPFLRPSLDSYKFPDHLIDWTNFKDRVEIVRHELINGVNCGEHVRYEAPWNTRDEIVFGSLDLVFSQAVLEHVDTLEEVYYTMFDWLKPGGYASHVIDFSAHHLSPVWNGHWAYSDSEWQLVRGRREFLLNREPLTAHLTYAKKAGYEVLLTSPVYDNHGLSVQTLAKRFRQLDAEDARTRGVMSILRKPLN